MTRYRLLLVEDNEDDANLAVMRLEEDGFEFDWDRVATRTDLTAALLQHPDAVVADFSVPGLDVRDTIRTVREADPDTPVIVLSGSMTAETGVELMRLGAQDYLSKSGLEKLSPALRLGLEMARDRRRMRFAEEEFENLFERLPVGVARNLPSGETVRINRALLRILRFPDIATYRAETTLLATEFLSAADRALLGAKLAGEGVAEGLEVEVRRYDGTRGWIRLDMSAAHGPDGEISSVDTVVTDIDDRKRAQSALQLSHETLGAALDGLRRSDAVRQRLLARLISAQEEERHRIALDIHDDAVQVMTAANIRLVTLGKKLSDEKLVAEVSLLVDTVAQSTARLRTLMFELRPPALERHGLVVAIRMTLEMLSSESGVQHTLSGELGEEPSGSTGVLIYRIVQEAIANVRKHSGAANVAVMVDGQGGAVTMSISDDGVGFDISAEEAEERPSHIGLASMRERASLAGGTWSVTSNPRAGTTVSFEIPAAAKPGRRVTLPFPVTT